MHRIWNEIHSLEVHVQHGTFLLGLSALAGAGFLRQDRAPPQKRSERYERTSQRSAEEESRAWRKKTSRWGTLDSN